MLNSRVKDLKPSATLAVVAKAAELRAAGVSILGLNAGEPDIDTPEHIKEGARIAMQEGKTKYTPVPGIPALREAIAKKLSVENGVTAIAETVTITNGGKQALFEAIQVLLEPGDEVIIPSPYWVSYPPMVELCGGKAIIVPTTLEQGYKLSADSLRKVLSSKTKLVILNSPSNPTGATYSKEELACLSEVLVSHQAFILSDEVYEKLTYGVPYTSFAKAAPQIEDRVITVGAFSKTYSMTGWRVGYATGPKEVIGAMNRVRSQTTSNVCSIAQYAALAAIEGPHDFLEPLKRSYETRFALALETLNKTPGIKPAAFPDGAFYLFVNIDSFLKESGMSGSVECASWLLEEARVAVVPGVAFGDDRAIRLSVSVAEDVVREGVARISDSFRSRMKV